VNGRNGIVISHEKGRRYAIHDPAIKFRGEHRACGLVVRERRNDPLSDAGVLRYAAVRRLETSGVRNYGRIFGWNM
jgi:hypothetical protein